MRIPSTVCMLLALGLGASLPASAGPGTEPWARLERRVLAQALGPSDQTGVGPIVVARLEYLLSGRGEQAAGPKWRGPGHAVAVAVEGPAGAATRQVFSFAWPIDTLTRPWPTEAAAWDWKQEVVWLFAARSTSLDHCDLVAFRLDAADGAATAGPVPNPAPGQLDAWFEKPTPIASTRVPVPDQKSEWVVNALVLVPEPEGFLVGLASRHAKSTRWLRFDAASESFAAAEGPPAPPARR